MSKFTKFSSEVRERGVRMAFDGKDLGIAQRKVLRAERSLPALQALRDWLVGLRPTEANGGGRRPSTMCCAVGRPLPAMPGPAICRPTTT